jgi:hypothetical protein
VAQGTWGVTATIETADTGVAFWGSNFLVVVDAWQPAGVGVEGTVEALDSYVVSGDLFGVADWVGVDPGLVVHVLSRRRLQNVQTRAYQVR